MGRDEGCSQDGVNVWGRVGAPVDGAIHDRHPVLWRALIGVGLPGHGRGRLIGSSPGDDAGYISTHFLTRDACAIIEK